MQHWRYLINGFLKFFIIFLNDIYSLMDFIGIFTWKYNYLHFFARHFGDTAMFRPN